MADMFMIDWSVASLVALLTLTLLEIVLGVDNVIFIAILSSKLPKEQQAKARNWGLILAMVQRIVLLFLAFWVIQLENIHVLQMFPIDPATVDPEHVDPEHPAALYHVDLSVKDCIVILGGLFLLYKAVHEIHEKLEGDPIGKQKAKAAASMRSVLTQIILLDMVFSVDSVLTAVGLTNQLPIMIVAVVISMVIMIVFAKGIAEFVERHPTVKMLALAILILIGFLLVTEGFGVHMPRGYVYFAMAFAFGVEMLNIKAGTRRKRKIADAGSSALD